MSRPEILNAIDDTGWIDLEYSSSFGNYNDDKDNKPQYRRIGKIVMMRGIATPKSNTPTDTSQVELFTFPNSLKPSKELIFVCPGSGVNKWLLYVKPNAIGTVTLARYGTTGITGASPGNWLPFNITYFVD